MWEPTELRAELKFPLSLEASHRDGQTDWQRETVKRHNATLRNYRDGFTIGKREQGILSLMEGIEVLVSTWAITADDDWFAAEQVWDMLQNVSNLLNYDCGMLDAYRGILSEWVCWTATRVGLDPDTGEAVS